MKHLSSSQHCRTTLRSFSVSVPFFTSSGVSIHTFCTTKVQILARFPSTKVQIPTSYLFDKPLQRSREVGLGDEVLQNKNKNKNKNKNTSGVNICTFVLGKASKLRTCR
jgi:hypothetical protein